MASDLDETKVTAYALGELDDAERSAVEALIAESETTRREVEEVRETAGLLRQALSAAPRHELTPEQRQAIETAAAKPVATRKRRFGRYAVLATGSAVAATLVFAVVAPSLLRARLDRMPLSARLREEDMMARNATQPLPSALPQDRYAQTKSLAYLGADKEDATDELRASSAPFQTEAYDHTPENPFVLVAHDPRSTFSVDVDTASYSNVRRFLTQGQLPPKDAVRIEELVNYFPYAYDPPTDGRPFAVHMEAVTCPWKTDHRLVRIAIKGREIPRGERPPSNLVFLLDVSGSMNEPNKLPLVKAAMRMLVNQLRSQDRVAIVVYAGSQGLALPSTPANEKGTILSAIESLSPGGTTHGSAGIQLAYEVAADNFIEGGVNRVILATDGDFNVGITDQGSLVRLIEQKAKSGVFLTTLGFGMGNLKDSTLEKLADHGNGNYAYIDGLSEARKVLVEQVGATLVTIAKDVKLQLEFNPAQVKAFRLIGYENRVLAHQDFNDDKKDAGDIGAGHTVTALYETVPPRADLAVPTVDPLKYQQPARPKTDSAELLTVKLRYKLPDGQRSSLIEASLMDEGASFENAPTDLKFAAAVAAFGMMLRESPHKGEASFGQVRAWASAGLDQDESGARAEFLRLLETARTLSRKQ